MQYSKVCAFFWLYSCDLWSFYMTLKEKNEKNLVLTLFFWFEGFLLEAHVPKVQTKTLVGHH